MFISDIIDHANCYVLVGYTYLFDRRRWLDLGSWAPGEHACMRWVTDCRTTDIGSDMATSRRPSSSFWAEVVSRSQAVALPRAVVIYGVLYPGGRWE